MIPPEFIEELKYRSDIESVVSQYVKLKKQGRGMVGLCPFHSEKTPSFNVNTQEQYFYCFGCGAGGDVVTFVRRIENLDYLQAIAFLAARAGLEMPGDADGGEGARLRTRILEANRRAARHFHENLISPAGAQAMRYLLARGLDEKIIRRFGIGYALESWDDLTLYMNKQGFKNEELETAYLSARGKKGGWYDRFRGRIMFPIIDARGGVIAFGGRAMGDLKPKYLNSSDTPVFKKSRNLFALNFAKNTKSGSLILTEGYMDAIAVYRAGLDNAVATLGTALTPEQARLIARHVPEAVIAYDSDEAGQTATKRASALLGEAGLKVRVLAMPGAKDPDEYVQKFGAQRFKLLFEGAASAVQYEIDKLRGSFDMETTQGRLGFIGEFTKLAAAIKSPVEREIYISGTAAAAGVSVQALTQQVQSLIDRRERMDERKRRRELRVQLSMDPNAPQGAARGPAGSLKAEELLLVSLIRDPSLYRGVADRVRPENFVSDVNRELFSAVCGRIANDLPLDMVSLGAALNIDSMARLSGLMAGSASLSFTKEQVEDYISAILERGNIKTGEEIKLMGDEDLRDYIASLARKKK